MVTSSDWPLIFDVYTECSLTAWMVDEVESTVHQLPAEKRPLYFLGDSSMLQICKKTYSVRRVAHHAWLSLYLTSRELPSTHFCVQTVSCVPYHATKSLSQELAVIAFVLFETLSPFILHFTLQQAGSGGLARNATTFTVISFQEMSS